MTTFKAEVYSHQKRSDGTYNIKIRITHNRVKKYLPTPFYVKQEDLTRKFKLKNQYYIDECDKIIKKYRSAVDHLGERGMSMSIDLLIDSIKRGSSAEHFDLDIIKFGRDLVKKMIAEGHESNAKFYTITLNNLVKFVGRENISVHEITYKFITDWIYYLVKMPTIHDKIKRAQSLYPSTLRAILNKAKAEYNDEELGIIRIPLSPFKKVKIPKFGVTRKRAIDIDALRKIAELPYKPVYNYGFRRYNLAKDMFLLSFMLIGINAADLYNCYDLKKGRLTYQRTKTKNRRQDKAEISILIQPEAEKLLQKYRDPDKMRVFCFYKMYSTSDSFTSAINNGLKKIGDDLGLNDLEFYAARHTWATIALNDAGVDKYTVHTSLDHVDEKMRVTDTYIKKSFDIIDQANRKVLDLVGFKIDNVAEPDREKYPLRFK